MSNFSSIFCDATLPHRRPVVVCLISICFCNDRLDIPLPIPLMALWIVITQKRHFCWCKSVTLSFAIIVEWALVTRCYYLICSFLEHCGTDAAGDNFKSIKMKTSQFGMKLWCTSTTQFADAYIHVYVTKLTRPLKIHLTLKTRKYRLVIVTCNIAQIAAVCVVRKNDLPTTKKAIGNRDFSLRRNICIATAPD